MAEGLNSATFKMQNYDLKEMTYDEADGYYKLEFKKGGVATSITEIQSSLSGRAFLIGKCKDLVAQGCKVLNTNLLFTF